MTTAFSRRHQMAALLFSIVSILPLVHAGAQTPPPRATVASVTPYVGYIAFGDFATGPLGTSVSNAGAALFGATLGIDMSPRVGLVGNIGFANTKLRGDLPLLGGYSFGDSKVLLLDANVHLALTVPVAVPAPGSTQMQFGTFVEAGVGAIRFDQSVGPLNTVATNFAFNVGAGADIGLTPSLDLRLSVKDYIGKFDFSDALGTAIGGRINSKVANNFAFTAGLKLSF
ncbi:MAG: outer membrane beta-barrel protein [Gemmatimonadetes bacterium]|nr:outer membrane beta-barrel protein [Gemmatimonadota bacterium]